MTSIAFDTLNARPILGLCGYPTIEVRARRTDGTRITASASAVASTGAHEAAELRGGGTAHSGCGVDNALTGFDRDIALMLLARHWSSINELDDALESLDGSADYQRLGALTEIDWDHSALPYGLT